MALTIRVRIGQTFTASGPVTHTDLNNILGNAVFELEGTISATSIPDGSITNAKMADDGVGQTSRIANEIITTDKIHKDHRHASILGASKNLVIKNNSGAPNNKVDITADEVILKNAGGGAFRAAAVSVSPDITAAVGLDGRETSLTEAADTWYYFWLISNGTLVKSVISVSETTPDLSDGAFTGYVYKALVGCVRNNGSGHFVGFCQFGSVVSFDRTNLFTGKAASASGTFQVLAGANLTTFQGLVPPIAKTFSGTIGKSDLAAAGDESGIEIASDTSGVGAVLCIGRRLTVTALSGFTLAAPFSGLVLKSSQNFAWRSHNNADASNRIDISGFTI